MRSKLSGVLNTPTLSCWHECQPHMTLFPLASSAGFGWCECNTFMARAAGEQNFPLPCDTTCRLLFGFASAEPQQRWLIYEPCGCARFTWTRLNGKREARRMKTLCFLFNFALSAVAHQTLTCSLCVQGLNRLLLCAGHLGWFVPDARFDTIKAKLCS